MGIESKQKEVIDALLVQAVPDPKRWCDCEGVGG
jgi:hypothetical protein